MKKPSITLGFTVIELLLYLLLGCILLALAVPLSTRFINKNRAEMVEGNVRAALQYARNMAYNNDLPLTLIPVNRDKDWSKGMLLLHGEKIIQQWRWQGKNIIVRWKGFQSNDYILFSTVLRQSTANGYFLIETLDGAVKKKVMVNRLGRASGGY